MPKFKILYERKGKFALIVPIFVSAGYEIIEAQNLGDAYKQAQAHLNAHGWMSEQFEGWKVAAILQEVNNTQSLNTEETKEAKN